MKKLIIVACASLSLMLAGEKAAAQKMGDNLLNAGLGLSFVRQGPVFFGASYEHMFSDFVSAGLGADVGFKGNRSRVTWLPLVARGSYHYGKHFLKVDNLDLYGGVQLGALISIAGGRFVDGGSATGIIFGVDAGARYYFKEDFGFFGEVTGASNGGSMLRIGVTFKP